MIIPPSLASKMLQGLSGSFAVGQDLPSGAVRALIHPLAVARAARLIARARSLSFRCLAQLTKIPWRKSDVKYVTNEIYFDMVEQVDATISSNQNLVACSVRR